jgi:CARDB protein
VSTRDDDIEFDFFDDRTQEAPAGDRAARRPSGSDGGGPRGPRRPSFGAPTGLTPLLRLIGLVAFAILVVVLLVFWVQSCQSDKKRDAYRDYLAGVARVSQTSDAVGRDFAELLTTPGLKQADLDDRLGGLVQNQQLDLDNARKLDPPGPLRPAHERMVQALEFRVAGLRGLVDVFEQTKGSKDATQAGALLAAQAERLLASDIVWADSFRAPALAVLKDEDISGVEVPESQFVQTPDLASQRSMTPIWQRIHGASTGGTPTGVHGNGIEGVKVLPSGKQLVPGQETTIQASTDLAFEVSVKNSGDSLESGVEVQLTIPKQPKSIVKTDTIDLIDAGETKTVTFSGFPTLPFGEKVNLRVDVKPVPGETNTGNNTVEFPVFFSI